MTQTSSFSVQYYLYFSPLLGGSTQLILLRADVLVFLAFAKILRVTCCFFYSDWRLPLESPRFFFHERVFKITHQFPFRSPLSPGTILPYNTCDGLSLFFPPQTDLPFKVQPTFFSHPRPPYWPQRRYPSFFDNFRSFFAYPDSLVLIPPASPPRHLSLSFKIVSKVRPF